jgi:hypothetical protein
MGDDIAVVSVPEIVPADSAFDVSIRSYGDGCVAKGETEVSSSDGVVEIRSYDYDQKLIRFDRACTEQLKLIEHHALVVFHQKGTATIRFVGKSEPGRQIVRVERSVVVQ